MGRSGAGHRGLGRCGGHPGADGGRRKGGLGAAEEAEAEVAALAIAIGAKAVPGWDTLGLVR